MATNLRLRSDAEKALRSRSAAVGRSQQELIREAVDRYLGLVAEPLVAEPVARTDQGALLASSGVLPARNAFRESSTLLHLRNGESTLSLLDREDRV